MKKLITLVAIMAFFASSAFAADTISAKTTIGGGDYTPSTKVVLSVISLPTSYAATSAHLNGTFEYGTGGGSAFAGDASKIVKKAYTTTTSSLVATPTAPTDATALAAGFN